MKIFHVINFSPKSPITDFRGIMQAQARYKPQEQPQTTAAIKSAPPSKSPLVSPTLSPVQRQPSKGPTPVGKKSQKQRKREMQAALAGGAGDRKEEGEEKGVQGQPVGERSPVPCPWWALSIHWSMCVQIAVCVCVFVFRFDGLDSQWWVECSPYIIKILIV